MDDQYGTGGEPAEPVDSLDLLAPALIHEIIPKLGEAFRELVVWHIPGNTYASAWEATCYRHNEYVQVAVIVWGCGTVVAHFSDHLDPDDVDGMGEVIGLVGCDALTIDEPWLLAALLPAVDRHSCGPLLDGLTQVPR